MKDTPTTLWSLEHEDERVSCQVRLVPYGIEVDILAGRQVVITRTFATDTEALAWADAKRHARETRGWKPVPPEADDTPLT